ncbi:MAG: hypothetical protein NTZ50_14985 [Chloroflexi bacterium]|nr:hypothetical protein [Chloroflexota bacterium]
MMSRGPAQLCGGQRVLNHASDGLRPARAAEVRIDAVERRMRVR